MTEFFLETIKLLAMLFCTILGITVFVFWWCFICAFLPTLLSKLLNWRELKFWHTLHCALAPDGNKTLILLIFYTGFFAQFFFLYLGLEAPYVLEDLLFMFSHT